MTYIEAHPAPALPTAGKKFLLFWNVVPNARDFHGWAYAVISIGSFGPVLLLVFAAVIRRRRQWRILAPFLLIVPILLCCTSLHIAKIASLRSIASPSSHC